MIMINRLKNDGKIQEKNSKRNPEIQEKKPK